jgi:cytoskeletal protein CcmA (bactofilin family)
METNRKEAEMFGFGVKKEGAFEGKLNCIIGEESSLRGDIDIKGSARIDGNLEGTIIATESIIIGKGGLVKADMQARDMVVAGTVIGNVKAEDRVELHAGARVDGNIETHTLIVDEGVVFNGKCAMVESAAGTEEGQGDPSGVDRGNDAHSWGEQTTARSRRDGLQGDGTGGRGTERELTGSGYGTRE